MQPSGTTKPAGLNN